MSTRTLSICLSIAALTASAFAQGGGRGMQQPPAPAGPWMDKSLPPDQRADMVIAQMTIDEKIQLVHGGQVARGAPSPSNGGAGWIPGIPRLGIPDINMADSAVGVTRGAAASRYSTLLPSTLGAAATWDPKAGHALRRSDRPRTARSGLQHVDRRRREHHARTAQRPQLRVPRRRPDPGRQDGGPVDEGRAGSADHRRHQALRAQRPGDRPQHRQRDPGQARPCARPTCWRSRSACANGAAGGDVLVQQGQRRLGLRERLPAQRRAEEGLRISRAS